MMIASFLCLYLLKFFPLNAGDVATATPKFVILTGFQPASANGNYTIDEDNTIWGEPTYWMTKSDGKDRLTYFLYYLKHDASRHSPAPVWELCEKEHYWSAKRHVLRGMYHCWAYSKQLVGKDWWQRDFDKPQGDRYAWVNRPEATSTKTLPESVVLGGFTKSFLNGKYTIRWMWQETIGGHPSYWKQRDDGQWVVLYYCSKKGDRYGRWNLGPSRFLKKLRTGKECTSWAMSPYQELSGKFWAESIDEGWVTMEAVVAVPSACAEKCRASGYCCNGDVKVGSNQYISCFQACEIRRRTDESTCQQHCDDVSHNRGCERTIDGVLYEFCSECEDLTSDRKCQWGVGGPDACHVGCRISGD